MPSLKELRARFESEKPGSPASNLAFKNWKAAVDAKQQDAEEATEPTEAETVKESKPKSRRARR